MYLHILGGKKLLTWTTTKMAKGWPSLGHNGLIFAGGTLWENCQFRNSSRSLIEDEDEIVISGISARLPRSENLDEFRKNLYGRIDMVTDTTRWTPGLYNLPTRTGQVENLDKFDASFFGIHARQADAMDPQARKILEVAYEAILDAGINPTSLRGSDTAIFSGMNSMELSEYLFYGASDETNAFSVLGNLGCFIANRISFHLNFHGPSLVINTSCSSGLHALSDAVGCMKQKKCTAALVTGTQIGLHPRNFKDLQNVQALAPDGACKAFDESANGYVRSDGIVAVFLERKSTAKRAYATIKAVGVNCDGFTPEGISVPSWEMQAGLVQRLCRENQIYPQTVQYVEAHGTGTPIGDPLEIRGITEAYCQEGQTRETPLLVGSVKTNTGHAEVASGLVALSKCLISIQEKKIPGNLHFKKANPNIPQLFDGTIQIVDKTRTFSSGLMAINNFGIGGTNAHLIIEPNWTKHSKGTEEAEFYCGYPLPLPPPLLVPFSGRTKEGVEEPLKKLQEGGAGFNDPSQVALIQNIFKQNIPGHSYRGFTILSRQPSSSPGLSLDAEGSNGSIGEIVVAEASGELKRPLYFVFPGMGGQWQGMGVDLVKSFPVFEESIAKSAAVLNQEFGESLYKLMDPKCTSIFENMRDAFLVNSAIQIALYDTMTEIGLTDHVTGFLGHSHGEVLVSYADGGLKADEVIRMCSVKGTTFMDQDCSGKATMAAVDLSWSDAHLKCPPGLIQPICHNSATNVTVAGLKNDVTLFVQEMKSQGIRAKEVNSCNQASHSWLNVGMKQPLLKAYRELIPTPKPRTSKWISTCLVPSVLKDPAKTADLPPNPDLCSAEYHVYNILNPVHFHEALTQVPKNSLMIEIGPQAVFQGILRQTMGKEAMMVAPMTRKSGVDKVNYFLNAMGTVYNSGGNFDVSKLYPKVTFPVSAETKMIAPLIKWDHSDSYLVPNFEELLAGKPIKIRVSDSFHSFLEGHKIDGRLVYPGMAYLVEAWKHFATLSAKRDFEKFPIIFENIEFKRAVFIPEKGEVTIILKIFQGSSKFEVAQGPDVVVSGDVRGCEAFGKEILNLNQLAPVQGSSQTLEGGAKLPLLNAEIYKELRLRGYEYGGDFKGISSLDSEGNWAKLKWLGNWTTFLDSILQTKAATLYSRQTFVPRRIQKIVIDPNILMESVKMAAVNSRENSNSMYRGPEVGLKIVKNLDTFQCPGIEIRGFEATKVQRRRPSLTPTIESYEFMPFIEGDGGGDANAKIQGLVKRVKSLGQIASIVKENCSDSLENLKIVELFGGHKFSAPLSKELSPIFKSNSYALLAEKNLTNELQDPEKMMDEFGPVKVTQVDTQDATLFGEIVGKNFSDSDLLILDEMGGPVINLAYANLRQNGFLLVRQNGECPHGLNVPDDFAIISKIMADPQENFLLLRKKIPGLTSNYETVSLDVGNFDWVETLQKKMAELEAIVADEGNKNHRIYLTSQSDQSGILGFAKSLRLEPGGHRIRVIYDPSKNLTLDTHNNGTPSKDLQEIVEKDLRLTVCQDSKLGTYVHQPIIDSDVTSTDPTTQKRPTQFAFLSTKTAGDLSSLYWQSSGLALKSKNDLIKVSYSALNFRDLMLATGKLPLDISSVVGRPGSDQSFLGLEFSGLNSKGQRVMGMIESQAVATFVDAKEAICWPIPESWSMEEAATVPVVYTTALYAFNRGQLKEGESILVHAGAGGVGQAAINLALSKNCKVFTTVGSPEKKKFLLELFPNLDPANIGNSRDASFETMVKERTRGRGVDVVLNSLAGDLLLASLRCLAAGGRFLEIGKQDAVQNSSVGLSWILKNISVLGIDLNMTEINRSTEQKKDFISMLQQEIDSGVVKPLKSSAFPYTNVEEAFRFMASGRHIGKVLIDMKDPRGCSRNDPGQMDQIELTQGCQKPNYFEAVQIDAVPKSYFSPEKTYIIIGGLGGLGLELAGNLVEHGAKKIVLASRSGVTNGYQQFCINAWKNFGVQVTTPTVNLADFDVAQNFMQTIQGEIGGFFNCAMVLRDGMFENQDRKKFEESCAAKIGISQNFDKLSRQKIENGGRGSFDHFVCISSAAAGRGNAGQTSYSYANAGMERICENRRRDRLPALAVQFGVIDDVGVVMEKMAGKPILSGPFKGSVGQKVFSCLEVIDYGLQQLTNGIISSIVFAPDDDDGVRGEGKGQKLAEKVAKILGIRGDICKINWSATLNEMGLDSLLTAEVKQTLEGEFSLILSNPDIRRLTFTNLEEIQEGNFKGPGGGSGGGVKGSEDGSKSTQKMDKNDQTTFTPLWTRTEPLVHLNPGLQPKNEGDLSPLFLVHGVEGHTDILRILASKIKRPVYGLELVQHKDEGSLSSVEAIAKHFLEEVKKVQAEGPYNFGGYSSGGVIAYEMATILEVEGQEVRSLLFLDGSCFLADGAMVAEENQREIHTSVYKLLLQDLAGKRESREMLSNQLTGRREEDLKIIAGSLHAHFPTQSLDKLDQFVGGIAQRALLVSHHCPEKRDGVGFKGQAVLIKADFASHFPEYDLPTDYHLSRFCFNPVTIHQVNGNHVTFLKEPHVSKVADIVNRHLN